MLNSQYVFEERYIQRVTFSTFMKHESKFDFENTTMWGYLIKILQSFKSTKTPNHLIMLKYS